jgi:hypothetical protein
MCSNQYVFEREQDIIALIEIILDLRNLDGICIGGVLAEAIVFGEVVYSLTTFLGGLKRKQLGVSDEDAQEWARKYVSSMMQSRSDSLMIEHLLANLPK